MARIEWSEDEHGARFLDLDVDGAFELARRVTRVENPDGSVTEVTEVALRVGPSLAHALPANTNASLALSDRGEHLLVAGGAL